MTEDNLFARLMRSAEGEPGPFVTVPTRSLVSDLRSLVLRRLQSRGGRPSDPNWTMTRLIPMSKKTWEGLRSLSTSISSEGGRTASRGQVAALLLEQALEVVLGQETQLDERVRHVRPAHASTDSTASRVVHLNQERSDTSAKLRSNAMTDRLEVAAERINALEQELKRSRDNVHVLKAKIRAVNTKLSELERAQRSAQERTGPHFVGSADLFKQLSARTTGVGGYRLKALCHESLSDASFKLAWKRSLSGRPQGVTHAPLYYRFWLHASEHDRVLEPTSALETRDDIERLVSELPLSVWMLSRRHLRDLAEHHQYVQPIPLDQEADGDLQSQRAVALDQVGKTALRQAALLNQIERDLTGLVPAAAGRLHAIGDLAALQMADLIADIAKRLK
jgi:hypothetical protein